MPTPRPGGAEEVAELVSWLLSPTAGYINGALIPVDGGASLLDVGMMEFQR
jgi:meso-butanediol dehydrogenase / (S,S)-butanediol dehydrogenase / diacetyl reductase